MNYLKFPLSFEETVATASMLYPVLADFYLRANGNWSASGKTIPRVLKKISREFAFKYSEAFRILFSSEMTYPVLAIAEEILAPFGGFLFAGYKSHAPAKFRKKSRKKIKTGKASPKRK